MSSHPPLTDLLTQVAREYPDAMVPGQIEDVQRIAFHIGFVIEKMRPRPVSELAIADLGGGIGLFSVGCSAAGFKRVVLVDDFEDQINKQQGDSIFALHKKYGVEIYSRDVVAKGLEGIPGGLDVVTSFDSMEHWHHSPKKLFHQVYAALNPGGLFFLGVPNCVNLRKRITVPFGIGKWSPMPNWYEEEIFRHHVREPDVDDLRYIARDMGLVDVQIMGRNWLGRVNHNPLVRRITPICDRILQLKPSFCADIYLVGKKP